ncbi:MAG: hypothetical protein HC890_04090 [Chloroflexaceae bacterium]|nr:hypothetical protein [Chloroflexaceae bacterium]
MLVILTEEQVLSPRKICPGCLMADHSGFPRWQGGKLGCGNYLGRRGDNQPELYECQMGFVLASIDSDLE